MLYPEYNFNRIIILSHFFFHQTILHKQPLHQLHSSVAMETGRLKHGSLEVKFLAPVWSHSLSFSWSYTQFIWFTPLNTLPSPATTPLALPLLSNIYNYEKLFWQSKLCCDGCVWWHQFSRTTSPPQFLIYTVPRISKVCLLFIFYSY